MQHSKREREREKDAGQSLGYTYNSMTIAIQRRAAALHVINTPVNKCLLLAQSDTCSCYEQI